MQRKLFLVFLMGLMGLIVSFKVNAAGQLGFESAEHMLLGETIQLRFSEEESALNPILHLSNGLNLTFAELIALSGDFYEIPGRPISLGATEEERQDRFMTSYRSLVEDPFAVTEVPKILAVMQQEYKDVLEGIERGENPLQIYAKISENNDRQWNCITGGSCAPSMWWLVPGRYIKLAKQDHDHFGDHALLTYDVCHEEALKTAKLAGETKDSKKLEVAYIMESFAIHFLSDRFSSGHIRTPRYELTAAVTPGVVGSVLAGYMHSEENQYGLHVHNALGDRWISYGDKLYLDPKNMTNRLILHKAIQYSVNQIYDAYLGKIVDQHPVLSLIPYADAELDENSQDISPLFYWNKAEKVLYRRYDLSNPASFRWTSDWWGWTTMLTLAELRGLPVESQRVLVAAGYGRKIVDAGLITDPTLIEYIKKK